MGKQKLKTPLPNRKYQVLRQSKLFPDSPVELCGVGLSHKDADEYARVMSLCEPEMVYKISLSTGKK